MSNQAGSKGTKRDFSTSTMEVDHYWVLGLPSGKEGAKLSREEIATAYRRKCKELHPDKRPGNSNAHVEFLKLQESYEILKDEAKREYFHLIMEKKMKADSSRGVKRQRQEEPLSFRTKYPTAQAKTGAGYHKFSRIRRFDIDEIRRAVFASKKSEIPLKRKAGVQVCCGKDDQEIKIQSFPMEGVWVQLG